MSERWTAYVAINKKACSETEYFYFSLPVTPSRCSLTYFVSSYGLFIMYKVTYKEFQRQIFFQCASITPFQIISCNTTVFKSRDWKLHQILRMPHVPAEIQIWSLLDTSKFISTRIIFYLIWDVNILIRLHWTGSNCLGFGGPELGFEEGIFSSLDSKFERRAPLSTAD
jgi:hypothetical protein